MERLRGFALPTAIVIAALIVAAAHVREQRYTLHTNGNTVWRLDSLTGDVVACSWSYSTPIACQPVLPTRPPS